jgi:uncharacterized RDD family membrane protein YckC
MAGPPVAPATANPYPPWQCIRVRCLTRQRLPISGVGYGGFWIRVLAAIIDAIILRVVVAPVSMIFSGLGLAGGMMGGLPHAGLAVLGGGVTFILLIFGSWLYEAFMESSSYQATLGKMIFGM